jgi:ATP phosphoribosyltransferase
VDGITIALSKGRIFEETLPLLAAAGIEPLENPETSRRLILPTNRENVRVVIVRATDTPTYVQYGAADLGVAGKDVLLEHGSDGLYQPIDLNIASCRMMVAVPAGFDYAERRAPGRASQGGDQVCQHCARALRRQGRAGRPDQALWFDGAGAAGRLADAIVDLVSTGSTLKANHLLACEHIMDISSRLIVNQAALKLKREMLAPILEAIAAVADR